MKPLALRRIRTTPVLLAVLVATSCGPDDNVAELPPADSTAASATPSPDQAPQQTTIRLVTYDSFPTADTPINDRLADFTAETGIAIELVVAGDTGTMLSKAELTAGNPEGDVMWGIDDSLLSRAIASNIFEPYVSPGLSEIPTAFTALVPNGEGTPVDFGDVCVNYDLAALDELGIDPPQTLEDLADPRYADLLVVQDPAASSPGLAFLLATIDEFGDEWPTYWQRLVDNGVQVVDGWTEAYYEQFSYAGGDRPLVVSYGSSPPFEVLFAATTLDSAPTGVVESTCYRQVEFAVILAGTEHPNEARLLIDFLISAEFQADVPLNLFVFPTNATVELDPAFVEYAVIPDSSRSIDPATVAQNREDWIDEWTDLVIG
jgi:thiamine transport system substrate-binding protein